MTRKRILKYIILATGIPVILLAILLFIVFSYQDNIKQYAVSQINSSLRSKVTVNDINVTLFKHFPFVSLDFHKIKIADPDNDKKTILQAKHVYLSFNIYDILQKRYKISKISIDSGTCNLIVDKTGKMNYNILKPDSATSDNKIQLNEINIENLQCNYSDYQNNFHFQSNIMDATLSFKRSNKLDNISCITHIVVDKLEQENSVWIKEKTIQAEFDLLVDESKHHLEIKNANLLFDQLNLELEGNYNFGNNPTIDLRTKATQTTIQGLLSLLPIKLPSALLAYQSDGNIRLNLAIKGNIGKNHTPAIDAGFTIHNGVLKETKSGTGIKDIECTGRFTNGKSRNQQTTLLEINPFSLHFEDGILTGTFKLENFKNPLITLTCDGKLPIGPLLKFQQNKYILQATGTIDAHFTVKGNVSELTKISTPGLISFGALTIDATNVKLASSPDRIISQLNTSIKLTGNALLIEQCNIRSDKSDISVDGSITNFYPYLFDRKKLDAKLHYQSAFLDVGHLLFFSTNRKANDTSALVLPDNISLELDMKVDELQFHLFKAKKMKAKLHWKDNKLLLKNMECFAMDGYIKTQGQLDMSPQGKFLIEINSQLSHINIHELFRQCADFGQKEITYQNLNGILDGKIDMVSVWSNKLVCETDKLWVGSDISITNGQIKNYKPLTALSKFARVEDLEDLKFTSLKNQIEIRNRVIYIPEMYAVNNALNFTLSGNHTFDNEIDYRLKIKLREFLTKRRNNQPNENEEVDESGKGMYLYLLMRGPLSDPKIRYDRLGVTTKIIEDLRKEKDNIKKLFLDEKDTLINEKNSKGNNKEELEFEKD